MGMPRRLETGKAHPREGREVKAAESVQYYLSRFLAGAHVVQLSPTIFDGNSVEVTVFRHGGRDHSHYQGRTIAEALSEAAKAEGLTKGR